MEQESKPEQKEDDPWQARAQSNAAGVYKDALVLLWQKMPQDATAEQRQHAKGVLLSLLDMATGSGALGLQMDDRFSDNRLEEMVDIAMGPNKPPDASMFIAGVTTRVAEMGLDLLEGAMRYFNGTVVRPLTGFRYYKAEARFASKVNQAIAALPERAVKGELSNDFQKLFDVTQQNLDQADTPYAFGKALVDFLVLASSLVTGPELFAAQLTTRLARLRKAVEKAAGAGKEFTKGKIGQIPVDATTIPQGGPLHIEPNKFDYIFGRVTTGKHNTGRSLQLKKVMEKLGVPDTPIGHKLLKDHWDRVARDVAIKPNTAFITEYGIQLTKSSSFTGPSGAKVTFETSFLIQQDWSFKFTSVIPYE